MYRHLLANDLQDLNMSYFISYLLVKIEAKEIFISSSNVIWKRFKQSAECLCSLSKRANIYANILLRKLLLTSKILNLATSKMGTLGSKTSLNLAPIVLNLAPSNEF